MPSLPTALADIPNGSVTSPRGFTAAAAHAGLKADGAPDVALLVGATSCATAGVFTKNALRAAPVVYDADLLAERPGRMRAVAMNARVANACTGAPGLAAARAMAQAAEQAAGLPPRTALVLSTGVIGVPLPLEQVADGLRAAAGARPASTRHATARFGRRSRTPCCRWHAPSRSPSSRMARVRRSSLRFTSWGGGAKPPHGTWVGRLPARPS